MGSHLLKKLSATAIPHEQIHNTCFHPGDTVYHLASYGNIYGQNDVREILRANLVEPMGMVDAGARLVYLSSQSVKLKVQTPYTRAKRAMEEFLLAIGGHCVIRPFTIVGIGDSPKHLVPTLIDSVLHGTEIEFASWPTHDYIDVEDVVEAIVNLAPHDGLFEAGSGRVHSNAEVLGIVEKVTGGTVNAKFATSLRPYDVRIYPSADGSGRIHGWAPKKTLEESISEQVRETIRREGVSA